MAVQLTQEEANRLIDMVKSSLIEQLVAPGRRERVEFDVQGESKKDLFSVSIFRGRINAKRVNYNARIKMNGTVLLELHVNPTNRHMNPDGKLITGSHWHLYREGYGLQFAFPADDLSDLSFTENTIAFLKRFNVIKRPEIVEQIEI